MDPSRLRDAWDRLTHDTSFRVATIYAGACWFLVEAVDTLGGSTALIRGLAVALALGFLVVVPAVWLLTRRGSGRAVEEPLPEADDAHRRPGVPDEPPGRRAGTRRWAVALVALVLLAVGAWWLGTGLAAGAVPTEATRIAVMPFHVSGSASVEELGVGLVDLLSAAMDDVAGIRTVSSRTVLARVGGDTEDPVPMERALEVGAELGAGSILTGSVTAAGGEVRIAAEVLPVEGGEALATAEVQGGEDRILSLTDELAVRLLSAMWQSSEPLPTVRTAALTTRSPAALRAHLRGERLLRRMQFEEAAESFREAVAADSTFSLAWLRLAESTAWSSPAGEDVDRRSGYMERALRYADRLPPREQSLVRATTAKVSGGFAALDSLESYVRRYPDDPYGWYLLGDSRYHAALLGRYDRDEIVQPFLEAVRLDPLFAMGLTHAVDMALAVGDRDEFERLMARYEEIASPDRVEIARRQAAIRWAPADSVPNAFLAQVRAMDGAPDLSRIGALVGSLGQRTRLDPAVDPMAYVVALDSSLAVIPGNSDWEHRVIQLTALHQLALGRMEGGLRRLDRLLRDAPPTALVQVPPRLRGPLIRTMWTMQYAEAGQARPEDLAALESAASQIPLASSVLHFAYLQRGDVDRAGRFAFDSGPLAPDVDTTAIALAFRGWERLIRGDTAAALQSIEEGVRRIGYLDIELINPVIFPYAVALSLDPGTRERGIRMLRWMVTYRATDTGAAYLALGRAHEAAGQDEQARGAYGQVLRLWEGAGAFRQDEVDEARRALIRLTGEG